MESGIQESSSLVRWAMARHVTNKQNNSDRHENDCRSRRFGSRLCRRLCLSLYNQPVQPEAYDERAM